MILYADTSALLKLLVNEPGRAAMASALAEAERVFSAAIGYVELRAAVAAATRGGRIPAAQRERTISAIEVIWAGVSDIQIDTPLLRQAGDLAERMQLRGYGAVHLAALFQAGPPGELTLACWDADLRRAARELGYALIPGE